MNAQKAVSDLLGSLDLQDSSDRLDGKTLRLLKVQEQLSKELNDDMSNLLSISDLSNELNRRNSLDELALRDLSDKLEKTILRVEDVMKDLSKD